MKIWLVLLPVLAAAPALAQVPAPAPPSTAGSAAVAQVSPRFTVFNAGREPIASVQASPVTEQDWGQNLIGRVQIPPGSALTVTPRERNTCLFDLRVTWADGRQVERRRENVCGAGRVYRLDEAQGR